MPYQESEFTTSDNRIGCPSCGFDILVPPCEIKQRYICVYCGHVVLIVVHDEGYNSPDPRHLC